jgi:hypothetical protein
MAFFDPNLVETFPNIEFCKLLGSLESVYELCNEW